MSKREYRLVIVDVETNSEVFEHRFDYDAGKIKFLPATNKMAAEVKKHAAMESEFDPK
jgi:uncharacterized membrane protein YdbT with pleckstrin-like domain